MSGMHTPGPWRARATEGYDDDACFAVVEADSPDDQDEIVSIADLPGLEPYASGEGQANARLIAAAPDLLEALRDLEAVLCNGSFETVIPGEFSRFAQARAAARTAIAKATTGQEQA